jgi:hypothetical protein
VIELRPILLALQRFLQQLVVFCKGTYITNSIIQLELLLMYVLCHGMKIKMHYYSNLLVIIPRENHISVPLPEGNQRLNTYHIFTTI